MTTPAKIELWMVEAVKEMMVKHLGFGASVGTNWMLLESDLVAIIAGHAPEQEWEAKEKALFLLMRDCLHSHNVVRNDIYWKLHKILKTEECSESLNRHSIAQGE